jgi:hypothetical protein
MNEEQLEALKRLMDAIAYVATGDAINQQRPRGIVENAENEVRAAFDLPLLS